MKRILRSLLFLGFAAVVVLLAFSAVRHRVTEEDRIALNDVFGPAISGVNLADSGFDAQIRFLAQMQRISHERMNMQKAMDFDTHRSANTVLAFGGGWCYDFSYWYEETLREVGMTTRHVALYHDLGGLFKTLSTSQGLSHAATEVKTKKGWLLVEPTVNKLWLDQQGNPLSASMIRDAAQAGEVTIDELELELLYPLYNESFFYIYGLYSRHGHFFKPFNPVPDIHYREFLQNL